MPFLPPVGSRARQGARDLPGDRFLRRDRGWKNVAAPSSESERECIRYVERANDRDDDRDRGNDRDGKDNDHDKKRDRD